MKKFITPLLFACFLLICNQSFSQCACTNTRIIELQDLETTTEAALFSFQMTSDANSCGSGYSDFWFIDQAGDTLNEWTGSGMWMPDPSQPALDTTTYTIRLRPGYTSFPVDFSGILRIWNPECTIPFKYEDLTDEELIDAEIAVQISPNPTLGAFDLTNYSGVPITSLEIYDASGKLVLLENANTASIDASKLMAGIYLVKFYSDDNVIATKKLVKQ